MKRQVFFDLDETVISCKSLLEVFKYYCLHTCVDDFRDRYELTIKSIEKMAFEGINRRLINQYFYSKFKGISQKEMQILAKDWFDINKVEFDFFYSNVVEELIRHQSAGDEVVLVSGSFVECVSLIANHLDIKEYLCVNLESIDGVYTGKILGEQTIGTGKIRSIKKYITDGMLSLKGSYGYTDHVSDLPLLLMVEHPVMVGNDGELLQYAKMKNWRIIN